MIVPPFEPFPPSYGWTRRHPARVIVGAMVLPAERAAVERIAAERGWTISRTAAEAIRQWVAALGEANNEQDPGANQGLANPSGVDALHEAYR